MNTVTEKPTAEELVKAMRDYLETLLALSTCRVPAELLEINRRLNETRMAMESAIYRYQNT